MAEEDTVASISRRFGVADYVVFALCLLVSAAIGIYFGCTGKKQKTAREFLMADRSMSIVPVSMSMLASFMSAVAILGMPAEIYSYGTMYCWIAVSYISSMYLAGHVYIPVFYRLQITSAYEYLEMRFNRATRILGAACYLLQMIMYLAIVLYAPSLALSAVTGINTWVSVLAIGGVCTFYTVLGGIKAVIWTDTLQTIIMFSGMMAVIIQGFINLGWSRVWKDATNSGRLDLFDWPKVFNPDPLERHTFWTLVIGGTVYWTATYGTNQAQVQRALTVPTLRKSQLTFWVNLPGLILVVVLGGMAGLIIYSHFRDCDPMRNGTINAKDQLYPLFVLEVLGHLPGLPGLIVAAVASGALSTVSSGLNSLSAVILTDIVSPLKREVMSEERAAIVTKIIAASLGVLCIALTFVVSLLGGILQAAISFFGICGGPILGIFTLGMFFPCANGKGAFVGLLVSMIMTLWVGLGAQFSKPYIYTYPTSVDGCPVHNQTLLSVNSSLIAGNDSLLYDHLAYNYNTTGVNSITTTTQSVEELLKQNRVGVQAIYSLSYMWLSGFAVMVCNIVGLIVSVITGGNDAESLDPKLISPVINRFCCCLPSSFRAKFYCGVDHYSYTEKTTSIELEEEK